MFKGVDRETILPDASEFYDNLTCDGFLTKDGEYKLCIEVRGNEIYQERADHNAKPDKEARAVLDEWHARHGLSDFALSKSPTRP